jgi:hypothetical protein
MVLTEVIREKKIHKTQIGLVSFKFNSLNRKKNGFNRS